MSRPRTPLAVGAIAALLLAGCGSSDDGAVDGVSTPSATKGSAVSAERCKENEAAGKITYITGFQYQASAGILDPIAAKALGYFDALCLDVEIQPGTGETAQNAQLVAAGTAQISSIAGNGDVLVNVANGVGVQAVAMFGHVPVATLMTKPDITDLKQLEGTTLGQKGALPVTIEAMLRAAGVDVSKITQVEVGYDPTVLVRGQVQSLTGYKSNEPLTLEAKGEKVKLWNPEDYGVPGSIATTIVNPAFLKDHRSAVEDFLRAQLKAYAHCEDDASECVADAAELSQAGYDTDHNVQVWQTESKLVDDSLPQGQVLGQIDDTAVRTEGDFLVRMGQIPAVPDLTTLVVPDLVTSLYADGQLVWPAP
ncbi:ABC transporter substrate-binding protein [Kineococcus sp. GCM10028916]|uniref:ABC transporter substrate-binding protein n=1 Tax=Kineococcus sp. GCM10028916 TaxID=3273394 RepID=UPI0036266960